MCVEGDEEGVGEWDRTGRQVFTETYTNRLMTNTTRKGISRLLSSGIVGKVQNVCGLIRSVVGILRV